MSHSLAERIPHVLKAEGAGLDQGRPEVLSAVDQWRLGSSSGGGKTARIYVFLAPASSICRAGHIVLQFVVEHQRLYMFFPFFFLVKVFPYST